MLIASPPTKIPAPFANGAGAAYTNVIPTPSQIGVSNGRASFTDGFPPLNFIPVAAGGVPPYGGDFNGLFNQLTAGLQWLQAGGPEVYDAAFATAAGVGGYPAQAIIQSATRPGLLWLNQVDGNTTNPDTGGANWIPLFGGPISGVTLWIRNDGNDSNNGATNDAAHAFLTIQGALTYVQQRYAPAGRPITLRLGTTSTYAAPTSIPTGINLTIQGDSSAQASYVISGNGSGSTGVIYAAGCTLLLIGLTISNTGTLTNWITASYGSNITLSNVSFTAVPTNNANAIMVALGGGSLTFGVGIVIATNAGNAFNVQGNGSITGQSGGGVTMSGGPNFTAATAQAVTCGSMTFNNTFTGAATGVRYNAFGNGVIQTNGGGASFIPGNSAGSTSTGGQYL